MGRVIKRVPLDFDAPHDQTWQGYVMPEELSLPDCPDCEGTGESPRYRELHSLWYGYIPFKPEDNGSVPVTPETPAVRAFAERNIATADWHYGTGEGAVVREAQRLCGLWNGSWSHHLNADDVRALVDGRRLRDFTSTWTKGDGWQPKDPPVIPTPEQVNEWDISTMGHDAINAWICIDARCAREGVPNRCATCEGTGDVGTAEQRAAAEAWERYEPPTGDGRQLWQTVSDAPMSPVFADAEGLIEWMTTPAVCWGATKEPYTREQASAFVLGDGWAPSFAASEATGVVDGVTWVTGVDS